MAFFNWIQNFCLPLSHHCKYGVPTALWPHCIVFLIIFKSLYLIWSVFDYEVSRCRTLVSVLRVNIWACWICRLFFIRFGKFLTIIFSNIFPPFSPFSWYSIRCMLEHSVLLHRSLRLFLFLQTFSSLFLRLYNF